MNWESSVLWGLLGIFSGLIISIIFYVFEKKPKTILFDRKSTLLITDKLSKIEGLSINFNNEPIVNLVSTDIKIINNGNDIIEPSDFAAADPLVLSVEEGMFLIYSSIEDFVVEVDKLVDLKLESLSNNTIKLNFDYMRKGQIIKLTLLHTGNILLSGTLKKGKIIEGMKNKNNDALYDELKLFVPMSIAILISLIFQYFFPVVNITVFINFLMIYSFVTYIVNKCKRIFSYNQLSRNTINVSHIEGNININE